MTEAAAFESIGTRLSAVARRSPEALAVVEGEGQLTYRALDAGASAIAWRLVEAAKRPRDAHVCLLFESKLRAIGAICGACRGGLAYVPLDAGDPQERLRFILGDCEPVALLTETSLEARARALAPPGVAVIVTDDVPASDEPLPPVDAEAIAYLFYTSGSTGQPKGVMQTHANLRFFAAAAARALRIGAGDRLSLLNGLSFAAANQQVFRALLHGATLCAYDVRRDGIQGLADWLDRERITVLHAVPGVLREMASRLPRDRVLPHLRVIHLGGDAVYASDVALCRAHTLEHCVVLNQLASTEAGMVAQNIIERRSALPASGIVPVGRAFEGLRIEIEREDGGAAQVDEVGELVVCGPHLSPGYWRRPDLDAAAYAPDRGQPGSRRFRSGDLGRLDAAGNLHFLGRKGGRVKVRGHSVDLMEVEAALAACPGVSQAAVIARGANSLEDRVQLVAYVAMSTGVPRAPAAIRRSLASRVPSYMLPADIVFIAALPHAASGKVDRAALAHVETLAPDAECPTDAPRDDTERTVAGMFEELLDIDAAGRSDDFFMLGGDSLLAMELQVLVREVYGVHLGNLHENATVAGIASAVQQSRSRASRAIPVLLPLWRAGTEPPMFIVHGRHGQAFIAPHFMRLLGDNQPVFAFQARGLDGLDEPHVTVEDMASDYLAAMRKERAQGPYFIAALCAGMYVAAVMARTLQAAGETVLPLLLLDPPPSVLHLGYAGISEEQFLSKMTTRRARGITAGPADDAGYMKCVLRTAMAFEQAIANHRPATYDGPVYVLTSRQRAQAADPLALRRIFTGRFKRYEVGASHRDVLDPKNPVFAGTLQRCVQLIREAARAPSRVSA